MLDKPSFLPKLPSEKRFGLMFAGIFLLAGGYVIYKSQPVALAAASFIAAAIFGILALAQPQLLRPLNRAWAELGLMLGKIVSPIVLGVIFFFVITPVALAMRLAGRDALKLGKQNTGSYWVERNPAGPLPSSFKDQF